MADGASGHGESQEQGQGQGQAPILRRGLWNYAMERWAPKNQAGRLAFEMAILIGFFLVLAVIVQLASS